MEEKHVFKVIKENNIERSPMDISVEEWVELLQKKGCEKYLDCIHAYMQMPEHQARPSVVDAKFGQKEGHYNAKIYNLGRWVAKELDRFEVINIKGDKCYWPIVMKEAKIVGHNRFIFILRDELAAAMEKAMEQGLVKLDTPLPQYESSVDA